MQYRRYRRRRYSRSLHPLHRSPFRHSFPRKTRFRSIKNAPNSSYSPEVRRKYLRGYYPPLESRHFRGPWPGHKKGNLRGSTPANWKLLSTMRTLSYLPQPSINFLGSVARQGLRMYIKGHPSQYSSPRDEL